MRPPHSTSALRALSPGGLIQQARFARFRLGAHYLFLLLVLSATRRMTNAKIKKSLNAMKGVDFMLNEIRWQLHLHEKEEEEQAQNPFAEGRWLWSYEDSKEGIN